MRREDIVTDTEVYRHIWITEGVKLVGRLEYDKKTVQWHMERDVNDNGQGNNENKC